MKRLYKGLLVLFFTLCIAMCAYAESDNPTFAGEEAFIKTYAEMYSINSDDELLTSLTDGIYKNSNADVLYVFHFYRGYLYRTRFKKFEKALSDFNYALKYKPDDEATLSELLFVYHNLNDVLGVIDIIKKQIKNHPNDINLYNSCAAAHGKLKNYNEVIFYTTESIKIQNKNPDAFKQKGVAQIKLGVLNKGLRDLNYARQQYLEKNDIENYKQTVALIDYFSNEQNKNNSNNHHELQNIKRAIQDLNATHIINGY